MRRLLLAALACAAASAVTPAVAPAHAKTCVPIPSVEGWSGVCVLGQSWLVCARDARMYPAVVVYVPNRGSGGDPCYPS